MLWLWVSEGEKLVSRRLTCVHLRLVETICKVPLWLWKLDTVERLEKTRVAKQVEVAREVQWWRAN